MSALNNTPFIKRGRGHLVSEEGVAFSFYLDGMMVWCLVSRAGTIYVFSERPVDKHKNNAFFCVTHRTIATAINKKQHYPIMRTMSKKELETYFWEKINPCFKSQDCFWTQEMLQKEHVEARCKVCTQESFYLLIAHVCSFFSILTKDITYIDFSAKTESIRESLDCQNWYYSPRTVNLCNDVFNG